MKHRTGRGFTLVELLVVIAIIGILVALLLPAVQAAREASRRSSCSNNSKQLGIGLHNYHDTYKIFPPAGMMRVTPANGFQFPTNDSSLSGKGLNWAAMLLPFIEQAPLYSKIDFTNDFAHANNLIIWGTNLSVMRCPSDGNNLITFTGPNGNWARGNYAANLGSQLGNNVNGMGNTNSHMMYRNIVGAQRGFFGWQQSGGLMSATDGTSNTVMLWEVRSGPVDSDARGTWALPRVGGSMVGGWDYVGDCNGIDDQTTWGDDVLNCLTGTASQAARMPCWNGGDGQFAARSSHPGGCHALLGDASTRFVAKAITANTLRAINSASGGEATDDF
jgi:prepilin-type N-terminal cleavage/methylation domain-containing protein